MMTTPLQMLRGKRFLIFSQILLSGVAIGLFTWRLTDLAKSIALKYVGVEANAWTYIFFHPYGSGLINYFMVALAMGLYALIFYSKGPIAILEETTDNVGYIAGCVIVSVIILPSLAFMGPLAGFVALPFVSVVPFMLFHSATKVFRICAYASPCVMLFFILLEALMVVRGPSLLMNEYADIYSQTQLKGVYVDNKKFLDDITKSGQLDAVKRFLETKYALGGMIGIVSDASGLTALTAKMYEDLGAAQKHVLTTGQLDPGRERRAESVPEPTDTKALPERLSAADIKTLRDFYIDNHLEYAHQNMQRGQVNHIGHVLNPLNELSYGKPFRNVYFQYGVGNTLLMKSVMDLFGQLSFQSYYKSYLFYVIYAVMFLVMLLYVFRDPIYVAGSFAAYAFAYFGTGYIGFLIAPGIVPSIRLFDVMALMSLLSFLRKGRVLCLVSAMTLSFLDTLIDFQFGMMLTASLTIGLILYAVENRHGWSKRTLLSASIAFFVLSFLLPDIFVKTGGGNTLEYYLLGYFSWPPSVIGSSVVVYLAVSYLFMIMLKKKTFPLKYFYLSIFAYVQCLLVYYYWSGLANHLPTVIPFAGIQLFLMLFILQKVVFVDKEVWQRAAGLAAQALLVGMVLLVFAGAAIFYMEKRAFLANFKTHKVYNWDFERARVISTIDPRPVKEAMAMIQGYSDPQKPGVYIISRYDNLIPFLARRYSMMQHFELDYSLITSKEVEDAILRIKMNRPECLFVDTAVDVVADPSFDPWAKVYNTPFDINERASRFGRMSELKKVFDGVRNDYVKIDQGELLSVYKRKVPD